MRKLYRGFEIDVARQKSMAGYRLMYYSIFRKSDGYEVTSGYSDDSDTVWTWLTMMKHRVDGFLLDPTEEELKSDMETVEEYKARIQAHHDENLKTLKQFAPDDIGVAVAHVKEMTRKNIAKHKTGRRDAGYE